MATELPQGGEDSQTIGSTTIIDLPDDVMTHILRRLDGPAVAAASCASSRLHSLSSHPNIWRDLCLSTWPSLRNPELLHLISSFPGSYRSFFSDAFPFPFTLPGHSRRQYTQSQLPRRLISVVDLYHKGAPVFSQVVETDTSTPLFYQMPFVISAVHPKPLADVPISPWDLSVSWVVIDPVRHRAVNLSSGWQYSVSPHWHKEQTLGKFEVVAWEGYDLEVLFGSGYGFEARLTMSNELSLGGDGLAILQGLMDGGRSLREAAINWIEESMNPTDEETNSTPPFFLWYC